MSNGNIFISYRREDTSGHAGRIYDRLNVRFSGRVFRDVAGINLGEDFVVAIERHVGDCEVFIELIGDRWATITDRAGKRRLDDPEDFVRLELATALRREITVIPILVNGATMPDGSTLPQDLAPLTRRNALEITESDFDHDVERLIKTLETILGATGIAPHPDRRRRLIWQVGLGVIALLVVGAIGFFAFSRKSSHNPAVVVNPTPVNQTSPDPNSNIKSSNSPSPNVSATSQIADELHTPSRDSSERRAITDALREEFSNYQSIHYLPDRGRIIFILHTLKVHNGWAWTLVEPRSEKDPNTSFSESSPFLLHQEGEHWRVMKMPLGVADPNDPEGLHYPHAKDVENIRAMHPTMPADILQ